MVGMMRSVGVGLLLSILLLSFLCKQAHSGHIDGDGNMKQLDPHKSNAHQWNSQKWHVTKKEITHVVKRASTGGGGGSGGGYGGSGGGGGGLTRPHSGSSQAKSKVTYISFILVGSMLFVILF